MGRTDNSVLTHSRSTPTSYPELFIEYEGKPLVVVFDGTTADHSNWTHPGFTVRWMASQLQGNPGAVSRGYWSWMDGAIDPPITQHKGKPESVTVTPAYFAGLGWTGDTVRAPVRVTRVLVSDPRSDMTMHAGWTAHGWHDAAEGDHWCCCSLQALALLHAHLPVE